MLPAFLFMLAGLVFLVFGADRFILGAAGTARCLGVSPLIIGLTIVGTATSAPEVLVGVVAALDGKTAIAIGNAIGSNIANVGLVLGATVLFKPLLVQSDTLRREYLLMLAASLLAMALMLDGRLTAPDGLILLIALGLMLGWVVWLAGRSQQNDPLKKDLDQEFGSRPDLGKSLLLVLFGLIVLLLGAEMLVEGAVFIARRLGLSELVIGLTIIAVGTSLPELAASIAGVMKGEADIVIGNIIGSNMFNMLMVLGIPGIIHEADFGRAVIYRDAAVMLLLMLSMGIMLLQHSKNRFDRKEGGALLLVFITYQTLLLVSA